jgi:hypothetical protein
MATSPLVTTHDLGSGFTLVPTAFGDSVTWDVTGPKGSLPASVVASEEVVPGDSERVMHPRIIRRLDMVLATLVDANLYN